MLLHFPQDICHSGPPISELTSQPRAFDDMYFLIDKYAPFVEGEEPPPRIEESQRVVFPTEADHTAIKFGSAESAAYAAKMREAAGN